MPKFKEIIARIFKVDTFTRLTLDRRLFATLKHYHFQDKKVLDVGSSLGPYNYLFQKSDYKTLDIDSNYSPDYCCDIHKMDCLEDESFDFVLATEVLEHCRDPFQAVTEIKRILKPGGTCILTTRFIFGLHGDKYGGKDYFRFTEASFKYVFQNYSSIKVYPLGNVRTAIWDLITLYIPIFKPLMLINRPLIRCVKDSNYHPNGYLVVAKK